MAKSTASLVSYLKATITQVSQLAVDATTDEYRTNILNIVVGNKTKARKL